MGSSLCPHQEYCLFHHRRHVYSPRQRQTWVNVDFGVALPIRSSSILESGPCACRRQYPFGTAQLAAGSNRRIWRQLGVSQPFRLRHSMTAIAVSGRIPGRSRLYRVADVGSSTYVPDTIYGARRSDLYVTKNHGVSFFDWALRTPLAEWHLHQDIAVDPSTAIPSMCLPAAGNHGSTGRVWKSTDSAKTGRHQLRASSLACQWFRLAA